LLRDLAAFVVGIAMLTVESISSPSFAHIIDQSPDCVKILDLNHNLLWMNANGLCAMEIDDFADVKGRQWCDLWPDGQRSNIFQVCSLALKGAPQRFEASCPTAKGAEKCWDVRVNLVFFMDGTPAGLLAISRDVTEVRRARDDMDLKIKEMHHRLGNTYTIAAGLMSAYARGVPQREEFARDMQSRLKGLHIAQSMFSGGDELRPVADIIDALTKPFSDQIKNFNFGATRDIMVNHRQADAIGLVLGELTVNAIKHGAIGHGGKIGISSEYKENAVVIIWSENLNNRIKKKARDGGQGLNLVKQIVGSDLGNLQFFWSEFNLRVELTLFIK
jgi:two-component sensor histidine kinase